MAHKRRSQKRIFKKNLPSSKHRVTRLDSVEKIDQFYENLSPAEKVAFIQDTSQWIEERDSQSEDMPTRFIDQATIDHLMQGFNRIVSEGMSHGKKLEPGVNIKVRSRDGYVIEGWVVSTNMPAHPTKGKPFAMQVGITDSDGFRIAAKDDTQDPRFALPDDMPAVRSLGLAQGLRAICVMHPEKVPDNIPVNLIAVECIEEMAQSAAYVYAHCDAQPLANSPELFHQYFSESFVTGFQFSLYALPRGLMQIYESLPEDRGYELAYRFSWEHFVKEPTPDKDGLIVGALDQLNAMYEEYQSVI